MKDLLDTLDVWRAAGTELDREVGRAVVVRTFGSAPRPEGSALIRAADGRIEGSVSGGCVEGSVAEEIDRARDSGQSRVFRYGISDEDAWDVGLQCGGTIDVLVQPSVPAATLDAARASVGERPRGSVVVTPLPVGSPAPAIGPTEAGEPAAPERPIIIGEDGSLEGSTGASTLDRALVDVALAALRRGTSGTVQLGDRSYFMESFPIRPRLVMVGAVDIARSLVGFARALGYETVVIDGRPVFATEARFPDVDRLIRGWLDEVADDIGLGPNDAVAVLSHDDKFDDPAITEALDRGCRYVGAIGSQKSQADRRARLREAGVPAGDLARLRGPIGLDLGGRAPAEIALAVMAEIVATRYGGSGLPMIERPAGVRVVKEPTPVVGG
jgi:xanthine dehydrogenase accessory factor